MPKFQYVGDEPRYYPDTNLSVVPNDVIEADVAPDFRFVPAGKKVVADVPNESQGE